MVKKSASYKEVERHIFKHYMEKAEEFFNTMQTAFEQKQWNSVGLNGTHSAISAFDALLVKKGSIRSTSQKHDSSANLLKRYIADKNLPKQISRFQKLLKLKNLIEYESRLFTQKEAEEVKLQTERLFDWVKEQLHKD